jgi:quercetin dioxygenase-like cupin family protein
MDHPSAMVLHEQDVDAESWNDGTRGVLAFHTLFGGPDSRTGQFTAGVADLDPAGWLGVHSHAQAEIYYVLRGELLLRLDGAEHRLRAGSAVFIPGGAPHGVTNVGTTPARLFYTLAAGSFDEVRYDFGEQAPPREP